MMGPKLTLVTAILMTLAALTWLVSARYVPSESGDGMMRWIVAVIFIVMSAVYWRLYFKRRSAK